MSPRTVAENFRCKAWNHSPQNAGRRCGNPISRNGYCWSHQNRIVRGAHPEDFCERCGSRNIVWFAPNEEWNEVMESPNGIVCPSCYVRAAEAKGIKAVWRLSREAR